MPVRVDRLSPADLSQLVTDVGPVPLNVGAILVLPGADPDALAAVLAARLGSVHRFRQVVRHAPPGFGRPYWVDDPTFDPAAHVSVLECDRLDDAGLADLGASEVVVPLDPTRPPWRVVVAHDTAGTVAALLVMHHVLADGVGGLAVLVGLVDGAPGVPAGDGPPTAAPRPGAAALLADAWRSRWAALRRLPRLVRTVRRAGAELGPGDRRERTGRTGGARRTGHAGAAPSSGLNARTGPRRAVHLVDVDLAALRAGTRSRGATVNDALLVAGAAAMRAVLVGRGAPAPDALVLSVPVSGRPPARPDAAPPMDPPGGPRRAADLGNQVGVMPVRTPTGGPLTDRLDAVAAHTRARKAGARGVSAVLVGPAFRALAALRLYRWFVDRQRLVNAFLTNLPGPTARLALGGRPITRLVPVTITAGNVAVAFAALSYAGRLAVTVITDPDVVPEGAELAAHLAAALADVAALADA